MPIFKLQLRLQEASRRGLEIYWSTVNGHMIGAPARTSTPILLVCTVCEVWRERVFMIIQKPNFNFFRNRQMLSKEEMEQMPRADWLVSSKPALHLWLGKKMDKEAQQRLSIMGNVVVPAMARFGLNLLYQMQQTKR